MDEPSTTDRNPDPYDNLPVAIKETMTRKEYLWLPGSLKDRLLEDYTEPETFYD